MSCKNICEKYRAQKVEEVVTMLKVTKDVLYARFLLIGMV